MEYNMEDLVPVAAKLADRYTSCQSTSISYDTARQLMRAVQYCIRAVPQGGCTLMPIEDHGLSATMAYEQGLKLRQKKFLQTKKLYRKIRNQFQSYGNLCYEDTILKGMPEFFRRYDLWFCPDDHLLTLDYPLIGFRTDLTGIDQIAHYLSGIEAEQTFLAHFPASQIETILTLSNKGYRTLINNLVIPVFYQAMAIHILNKKSPSPEGWPQLTETDIDSLNQIATSYSKRTIELLLARAFDQLTRTLHLTSSKEIQYLKQALPDLACSYIHNAQYGQLHQLFAASTTPRNTVPALEFIEGTSLSASAMKTLLTDIADLPGIPDKAALIRNRVTSLTDLKEILKECFYNDEYHQVFALLSSIERQILQKEIIQKQTFNIPLEEWETTLLRNTNTIAQHEKMPPIVLP